MEGPLRSVTRIAIVKLSMVSRVPMKPLLRSSAEGRLSPLLLIMTLQLVSFASRLLVSALVLRLLMAQSLLFAIASGSKRRTLRVIRVIVLIVRRDRVHVLTSVVVKSSKRRLVRRLVTILLRLNLPHARFLVVLILLVSMRRMFLRTLVTLILLLVKFTISRLFLVLVAFGRKRATSRRTKRLILLIALVARSLRSILLLIITKRLRLSRSLKGRRMALRHGILSIVIRTRYLPRSPL